MELFFRVTAAVMVTVILVLTITPHNKELALLLTVAVCCMAVAAAGQFLQPVIGFLNELQQIGRLDNAYLAILLKIVGIGFLSEVAGLVCNDAGNATLGKTLQMTAACVILWLSIPLLSSLLELIQEILGGI